MDASNFIFKTGRGKNTRLDNAYSDLVKGVLNDGNDADHDRWEIYNLIIKELLSQGNDCFEEIKYRITDGENPNDVFIDVLTNHDDGLTGLAWFLKRRVEEFKEEDELKKFY